MIGPGTRRISPKGLEAWLLKDVWTVGQAAFLLAGNVPPAMLRAAHILNNRSAATPEDLPAIWAHRLVRAICVYPDLPTKHQDPELPIQMWTVDPLSVARWAISDVTMWDYDFGLCSTNKALGGEDALVFGLSIECVLELISQQSSSVTELTKASDEDTNPPSWLDAKLRKWVMGIALGIVEQYFGPAEFARGVGRNNALLAAKTWGHLAYVFEVKIRDKPFSRWPSKEPWPPAIHEGLVAWLKSELGDFEGSIPSYKDLQTRAGELSPSRK